MVYYNLTDEEQKEIDDIEQAYKKGELVSVPNFEKRKKNYRK